MRWNTEVGADCALGLPAESKTESAIAKGLAKGLADDLPRVYLEAAQLSVA